MLDPSDRLLIYLLPADLVSTGPVPTDLALTGSDPCMQRADGLT